MESRLRSKVTGLAAGIALTVAMAGPASAAADSGIRHHPCPNNNTGVITLQLRGTGNTWGPGDWQTGGGYPEWQNTGGVYRTITDGGRMTGGGYYRVVANDTYRNLVPSCRLTG
jgi:hypothetical protein